MTEKMMNGTNRVINFLLTVVIVFQLSSCKRDTCNSALGDTFTTIDASSVLEFEGAYSLSGTMVTLEDLSEEYFQDADLNSNVKDRFGEEWDNDAELVESFSFSQDMFQLFFTQEDLSALGLISLHFRLGDRQDYIDCQHGGSGDTYYLNMEFSVEEVEEGQLKVTDFAWSEEFKAGGF